MLTDGIQLADDSVAINFQIQNGIVLPSTGLNIGEMFYVNTGGGQGLYVYDGTVWQVAGGASGVSNAIDLTGTTLAANIVSSSLTSVGTLTSLSVTGTVSAASPTSASHLTTKQYVDNVAAGLDPKGSVRAGTTANIALTGTQTVDGVALIAGDRVLVKNQSTASQNGIYVVAAGAWTRSADFDGSPTDEVTSGAYTFITEGTTQGDTGWVLTTNDPISLNSTALAFTQFSASTSLLAAGAATQVQFNTSGVLGASARLTFADASANLQVGESGGNTSGKLTSGPGVSLEIYPAFLNTVNPGSDLFLTGGLGARRGGSVYIAGAAESTNGYGGGDVFVTGGAGLNAVGYSGSVVLRGGQGTAAQGEVVVQTAGVRRFAIGGDGSWKLGVGSAVGTAGQVLTSNGSAEPTWTTVASAAAAGTLTGSTLASNVVSSSLTSVGTLGSLVISGATTFGTSFTETPAAVTAAGTTNLNCALGNNFSIALGTSITSLTFTNIPASGRLYSASLFITQGSGGGFGITWPGSISWTGNIAPTLSVVAGRTDVITLVTRDGGGTWIGLAADSSSTGAAASTLSGSTLASNVVSSSLTSLGTLTSVNISGLLYLNSSSGTAGQVLTSNAGAAPTWTTLASSTSAGSLTGTVLASNVVDSSLTSVGTLASLTVTGQGQFGTLLVPGTATFGSASIAGLLTTPTTTLGTGNGFTIRVGSSASVTPGQLTLSGGDTSAAGTTAGPVVINGGNGSNATGVGSNVTINGGTGGASGTGGYFAVGTASTNTIVERLRIARTGEWTLAGVTGTAGQVLTANGAGAAPTWTTVASAAAAGTLTGTTLATNVVSSSLTSLGTLSALTMGSAINLGGFAASNAAAPTVGTDLTTKNYVDSAIAGLSWKNSVAVATTANITLSGTQTIDGVAVIAGQRVLVKNQTSTPTNGIYVVAAGAWSRATDSTTAAQLDGGAVYVLQGTTQADTGWTETAAVTTVGTDPIVFAQFGGSSTYAAGTGISLTGNTFANTGVTSIVAGTNVTISSATGAVTINAPTPTTLFATTTTPANTATNVSAGLQNQIAVLTFYNTTPTTGNRNVAFHVDNVAGGDFYGRVAGDGGISGGFANFMRIQRSGNSVTNFEILGSTVTLTGLASGLSVNGVVGTTGQVLTSNGAAAPTWQTAAGGAAAAGTLTGTTLASNVVSSSLTTVGTLTGLSVSGVITALSDAQPLRSQLSTSAGYGGVRVANQLGTRIIEMISIGSTAAAAYGMVASEAGINTAVGSNLVFSAGDTRRMEINNSTGNVGIGGAAVNRLDVFHTVTGIGARVRNSSTGVELAIRTDATSAGLDAGNATGGMTFSLNTVETVRFLANGSISFGSSGTAVGTAGQVLTSNGAAAAPTWQTAAAGAAAAGTLTGTTLAANVVSSSLTSVAASATVGGIEIGYRNLPRVTTFTSAAPGKRVAVTAGFTIPATTYSGGGAIAVGDIISFYNDSAAAITITAGAGLTMYKDGQASVVTTLLLSPRGSCVVWYNTVIEVVVSGSIA